MGGGGGKGFLNKTLGVLEKVWLLKKWGNSQFSEPIFFKGQILSRTKFFQEPKFELNDPHFSRAKLVQESPMFFQEPLPPPPPMN